jgi:hypothetical protein
MFSLDDQSVQHLYVHEGHNQIVAASTSIDLQLMIFTLYITEQSHYASYLVELKYPHRVFGLKPTREQEKIQVRNT